MFRFLHAADVHLDSPLSGLDRYEGAPVAEIRTATRRAFAELISLAIEEQVAFVLLAGDIFDGELRDFNAALFFNSQMARLKEHEIRAYVVYGNHDAASRMGKQLPSPDNVHIFSTRSAETVRLEEIDVAIHGRSFARSAVTDDLSAKYPAAAHGCFNIGVLHTALDGREGHDPYAPCTVDGLLSKGYDYWALGHVHCREIVHKAPWIVFPGNVQGRDIGEAGSKGCTLVAVDGDEVSLEHRDVDVFRWYRCEVDAGGANDGHDIVERVAQELERMREAADDRPFAVRLSVVGACGQYAAIVGRLDRWMSEIRNIANDVGAGDIWIEKVQFDLLAPGEQDAALLGVPRELLRQITEFGDEQGDVDLLLDLVRPLLERLPSDPTQGPAGIDIGSPDGIRILARQAGALLMNRLGEEGRAVAEE